MSYIIAAPWTKAVKITLSIVVYTGVSPKIIFGLWGRKKRELENNKTIFEICVLNPFHGQKIKENCFWTGSLLTRAAQKFSRKLCPTNNLW